MQLFETKNRNSWEVLLTVVTESFLLNLTGLLDPTLKGINLDNGTKGFHPAFNSTCQQKKTIKQRVKYIQLSQ